MIGALSACNPAGDGFASGPSSGAHGFQAPSQTAVQKQRKWSTDALLYAGDGSWSDEVGSLENIMNSNHMSFLAVSSADLDAMSLDELAQFGVLVFPGGHGGVIADSLSAATHARLRAAVQQRGVSYIGFCAGAFVAVNPKPTPGQDVNYGFGVVDGPELPYYYLENTLNPDIAMTMETFADGSKRDLVWYGGPITPSVPGGVIAQYPNGEPAITELQSGNGFVILSAVHPTATQATRDVFGLHDSDGLDLDIAWNLLHAALHSKPLPAF